MNHQGIMQPIHDIGLLPAVVLDDDLMRGRLPKHYVKDHCRWQK